MWRGLSCWGNPLFCRRRVRHAEGYLSLETGRYEEDVSASQEEAEEHARLSRAHGDEKWAESSRASSGEGSVETHGE